MQDHIEVIQDNTKPYNDNRVYAGFFPRWVAYMIDSVIAFIVGGIIKAPFGLAAGAGLTALKANFLFQYSFVDVIGYVGMVSYFILMTYFAHTTLGKMLLRLEVVTADGEWTFTNILYRETVGRFLSDIMCIGYLAVIVTEKKQGFHDMLCDTYVVYKDMAGTVRKVNVKPAVAGGPDVPISPYISEKQVSMSVPNKQVSPYVSDSYNSSSETVEENSNKSAFIMPEDKE